MSAFFSLDFIFLIVFILKFGTEQRVFNIISVLFYFLPKLIYHCKSAFPPT